ncbi:Pentatricopeptide repeat-containing protein At3g04750, mitochondrial [Linum perenne]
MYLSGRGIRFLSCIANGKNSHWDPTVSLHLNHQSLLLLEKCSDRVQFKQVLAHVMRSNLIGQTFPISRLIFFSAISYPENLDLGLILFERFTPNPNLFIYNTMISALRSAAGKQTLSCFDVYSSLLCSGVSPDGNTLLYLIRASKFVAESMMIHCHAVVLGLQSYAYLQNFLLKVYLEKGLVFLARKVFDKMSCPDTVSFNTMINGYAKQGFASEAVQVFRQMYDIEPDDYTMSGLLVSCGQLGNAKLGKSVHAWMVKNKSLAFSSSNLILSNALLDMYVKCCELKVADRLFRTLKAKDVVSWNIMIAGCSKLGNLELARSFFDQMPNLDLVSWNSLISGYARSGEFTMIRLLLHEMRLRNMIPDSVTMSSLISAASESGDLEQGRSVHGRLIRTLTKIDALLGSALIEMYYKNGILDKAFMIFNAVTRKDVTIWTTMITAFAFHGHGSKALKLFSAMKEEVVPNEVTFISVLSACSHSGFVDQGLTIFNSMEKYGIQPGVEHYGCLVDLLGRSGRLHEAKLVVESMPMRPSSSIWGAVLTACRARGDVEMAEKALTELLELEPEDDGGYTVLSNLYAAGGKWRSSNKVREAMGGKGVKKTAGCSAVVVDGVTHSFMASEKQHRRWLEIESVINCVNGEMMNFMAECTLLFSVHQSLY